MIKNKSLKKLAIYVYNLLPVGFIKVSLLKKWIHHKSIPKKVHTFVVSSTGVKFVTDQSPATRLLYWGGKNAYENNEIPMWEILCKNSKNIVEIGANVGIYSVFGALSNPEAKFVVYEAFYNNYAILLRNLRENSINNIEAINKAVVGNDSFDTIRFTLPEAEDFFSSPTGGFIESAEIAGRAAGKIIEVATVSSKLALKGGDLIKLDIEGAEFEILNYASEIFIDSRPTILIELLPTSKKLRSFVSGTMNSCKYKAFVLNSSAQLSEVHHEQIQYIDLQKQFATLDIVLIPNEKMDWLRFIFKDFRVVLNQQPKCL